MKRIGLFITILGVSVAAAASFMIVGGINPSKPYQVSSTATTHNNLFETTLQEDVSFHQRQMMDNPNIEIDLNINPARKCSVCIGVRAFNLFQCLLCHIVCRGDGIVPFMTMKL